MAHDRPKRRPLRLFAAAYPPPGIARALLDSLATLSLPPHRATPASQLHLTLHFLGDIEEREVARVEESIGRACHGVAPFVLRPEALIALPGRGMARLVAARTDAPGPLRALQQALVQRLVRAPRRRPGDRYLPHLTLCRFRSPSAAPPELPRSLEPVPAFEVAAVHLVRSRLEPTGAVHETIFEARLSGRG